MTIHEITERVQVGDFQSAYDNIIQIGEACTKCLDYSDDEMKKNKPMEDLLVDLVTIGNCTYNNTDRDYLPIDDGVYDLLVEKLKRVNYYRFVPGAAPVKTTIENSKDAIIDTKSEDIVKPFTIMSREDREKIDDAFYPQILTMAKPYDLRSNVYKPFYTKDTGMNYVTKRLHDTAHNYPNLVGTLDKCKFVLTKQAVDLGVAKDPNVSILERDFFEPLLRSGLLNMQTPIDMIGTLKYDGVSVEADCTDEVVGARSRGDTDNNVASDLTPILGGYKFPNAPKLDKPIGVKFEAIVRNVDLQLLNECFGTSYINGRTAIIGILGSSNASQLRDFITLVPLQADFGPDVPKPSRIDEITFLNKYYATREYLRYVEFHDTFTNLMFKINKYVSEAEYFRQWGTFMYDGVVLELTNPDFVEKLGRKGAINQYEMAVKFNPLKRITTFTGFTYTVGQNGTITPMIHYTPIEFMGAIHTKSTGSSYERFRDLDLRIGDQIAVSYINDVMPYVTKIDTEANRINHQKPILPEETFPTNCPSCGSELLPSIGGKTMRCPNPDCPEKNKQRAANMLAKLGIKDFGESFVDIMGPCSLSQLMEMSVDDFAKLGPTNAQKIYNQLQNLKVNKLPDYRIIGALGFTNVSAKKWKTIFSNIPLEEVFSMYGMLDDETFIDTLANIKGVGPITASVIADEFTFFFPDIMYIFIHSMYIPTPVGDGGDKYVIRFTGFRDAEFAEVLNKLPYVDCDPDAGVTKKTTHLLVPYSGFSSTKVNKAKQYGIQIVDAKDFMKNTALYIPEAVEN